MRVFDEGRFVADGVSLAAGLTVCNRCIVFQSGANATGSDGSVAAIVQSQWTVS